MRTYVIVAVLIGFIVGIALGCATSRDVPAAIAEGVSGGKYQVIAGPKSGGNTIFLRYDVNSGQAWSWTPGVGRSWVPLTDSE